MKNTVVVSLLFILLLPASSQSKERKVLFLGNSYTGVNNLPQIISDIAINMGDTLIFDLYTPGGYTLDQHSIDSIAINKIINGDWDYVVLQDQSQIPALPNYFSQGAISLCFQIRDAKPCARPVFYMTWGRQNGDATNCTVWPPVCTYEGMDSLLRNSYTEMAISNKAELSPVGKVWNNIRSNHPTINLYQTDGSHPSEAGSYVAACTFYTILFKNDIISCSYNYTLDSLTAATIRDAASEIVFDSLSNYDFTENNPQANFRYTIGQGMNEAELINFSLNADSYSWDFGDGTFSTAEFPTHNYQNDGVYTITLDASDCDLDTVYHSVTQRQISFCSFSPTIFPDSILLCPNTLDTLYTQNYNSYQWLDSNGDSIFNATNMYLPLTAGGEYSVIVDSAGCIELSRPVTVDELFNLVFYQVSVDGNYIYSDSACIGDTLMLVLFPNKPPFPDDQYVEWFENGIVIPGSQNDTLLISTSANYGVRLYSPFCAGHIVYENQTLPFNFYNCNPGILEFPEEFFITVYPNPADGFLTLKVDPKLTGTTYRIFDVTAREIISGTVNESETTIDVHAFGKGIYFLQMNGNGNLMRKLVIN